MQEPEMKEYFVYVAVRLYASSDDQIRKEAKNLTEGLGDSEQTMVHLISINNLDEHIEVPI